MAEPEARVDDGDLVDGGDPVGVVAQGDLVGVVIQGDLVSVVTQGDLVVPLFLALQHLAGTVEL